ncbi:trigger factor [Litorihabitans aurantiacus]|uniref:Trigger factor n=1 Tax=Litorihabitans aurantiacus TaxID=1930061 RepID=A0AA37XF43_9MICO|nr:trigger factor [Litorihabitans aurantiacus]GMA31890.1 trigger factor [Litorihabitans aurantiacus]
MKSAVETLEPTRVKLTVEVTLDELTPSIQHAYQHIAKDVSIPGFRKGKVPARILEQRIGFGPIIEHAVNDALPGFYREAVTEAGLSPLGQPDVEVTTIPTSAKEGELAFTAEVDVRPEIALPELSGLAIEVDSLEVSDDEVDERIEVMRQRFGTLAGVERAAKDGDFVVLDLNATIDGEEVDTVSGVSYQIGSGNMLEGLDEAVTGLSADESTTFTAPLAGGERAGEQAEVSVTITAVKEQELPELDDDFAQLASEFDTLAELTDDVRTQAAAGKVDGQAVQARDKLLDALLAQVDFPVPAAVVEAEVHRHLEGEGRLEDDEHRAEVQVEATESLRRQLLLDVLAEQLKVRVAQEELIDFLVRTAQQYRVDPNEFVQNADKTGQIPVFVGELARNKSLALALRQVSVTDGDGNAVDLTPFIGSDELDAAASGEGASADGGDTEVVEVATEEAPAEAAATTDEAPTEKPKRVRKAPAKTAEATDAEEAPAEKPKRARKAPAKKTEETAEAPAKKAPAKKTTKKAAEKAADEA